MNIEWPDTIRAYQYQIKIGVLYWMWKIDGRGQMSVRLDDKKFDRLVGNQGGNARRD